MGNNKPFDLMVEDLKANIYNTLNTSGLPMSVIHLVVNEVHKDVKEQHVKHIQQLALEEQRKIAENPVEVVEVEQ